jgi:hypothetical protein
MTTYRINATRRLVLSATWFDTLTDAQKEAYLKEHPDSKYAKGWHPSKEEDLGDANDVPEQETFLSKIRSKIIEKLGGQVKTRVTKKIKGFDSDAVFTDTKGNEREVHLLYTPTMIKNRDMEDRFGYWLDKNTYVYMTKKEFKKLNKKQLLNIQHRQQMYGL